MGYTPKKLRRILKSMIRKLGERREEFVKRPGRDFTRPRTLTFETVISLLLTMSENSIGKVLMERFQNNEQTPSASAFVQQRQKLLPSALETLFHCFTDSLRPEKTFRGYHLLAGDGSSLKSAAYPEDPASYRPGTPRQHGWNLWHMNALYDLENGIYTDLVVQKEHEKNECKALSKAWTLAGLVLIFNHHCLATEITVPSVSFSIEVISLSNSDLSNHYDPSVSQI